MECNPLCRTKQNRKDVSSLRDDAMLLSCITDPFANPTNDIKSWVVTTIILQKQNRMLIKLNDT